MKKILLASKNAHKLEEFRKILEPFGFEVVSLASMNDFDEVEETGRTFKDNALIKARYYYEKYHVDTISDDSGISFDYFNGFPGIYSARFMAHLDYPAKNKLITDMFKDIKNRKAHYTCDIALIINGEEKVFEGLWYGEVAQEPVGVNGFGYDPIFYLPSEGMTSAEVSPEYKNEHSHRAIALKEMVKYLETNHL